MDRIDRAKTYIQRLTGYRPTVGLILGSGLGDLGHEIEEAIKIPYDEIPFFSSTTVESHAGLLVIGKLEGKVVVAMQGRFHYYEGHSMDAITFPVRVMKALGVERLLITNSSGGVNESYQAGDVMVVSDHINLTGVNPLIGPNDGRLGVRFPDLTNAYCADLRRLAHETAAAQGLRMHEGVYVGWAGPTFETPAEIRMTRIVGGDAVGMSTIPEVIVANHAGMKVLALSCVCNMAAGILPGGLTAEEVFEAAQELKGRLIGLVRAILKVM
ncbi:purine-nucleoside phosphorylase [Paenibacillus beijingensis]|uniref:Purine nucleoside phosphorylase n=1 Tax=Paenibacillus beijingensis TaxID=1126833 RepID=A0A0D5NRV7_9BACL|nr:purine-nucleoside phosphorylase [Paenibacillus beijingensis]AJY77717.1 purine nucleoside phosphorylase [Paenibacillus beijingensis]